ncbi:hypothetical protein JMJ77_0009463, partial [Colletotrichum scovillei]
HTTLFPLLPFHHTSRTTKLEPSTDLPLPTASCSSREISQLQGSLEMGCHVHGRVSNTDGSPKIRRNFPPARRPLSKSRARDLDEGKKKRGQSLGQVSQRSIGRMLAGRTSEKRNNIS